MKKEQGPDRTRRLIMGVAGMIGLAAAVYLSMSPQFRRQEIHKCATTNENWQTGPLTEAAIAVQEFVPQESELMQIAVWVNRQDNSASEGMLRLTVYDGQGVGLAVCERPVAELTTNNWEWFDVGIELNVGQTYYFSMETTFPLETVFPLETIGGEVCPTAVYRPLHLDRIEENVRFLYGGEPVEGGSAACQYRYRMPLTVWEGVIYFTFSLFFAFAAGELVCRIVYKGSDRGRKI